MKLKTRRKFARTILTIVGVIIFINILLPDKSYSHKELEYKKITILNGDTLWSIAKDEQENNDFFNGKDIRDIVQSIKEANNLTSSNLIVNQTLKVPIY